MAADTIAWTKKTVFGDMRVHMGVITAGGAGDAVATGLRWVTDAQITPIASMNSAGLKNISINTDASGAGDVEIQDATAGDDFRLLVFGR